VLQAAFQGNLAFLLGLLTISTAIGISAFIIARRHNGHPAWAYALFGMVIVLSLGATLFLPGATGASGRCVMNRDFREPFLTEQGLFNAAMFLPIGLFGTIAVKRALPVATGAVVLSVAIELSQALILDPPRDDWPVDREIGRGAC
jgi:hypothetical protein